MKEIEKRVSLTATQAAGVVGVLNKSNVGWTMNERLLMDFSGSLDNRDLQVMVRANNGVPELSVKRGGVDQTVRLEANVHVSSSLSELLETVNLLGFSQASYGLRSMKTCVYKGVECSFRYIRDIKDPASILGVNFELEALAGSGEAEIDALLKEFNLTPLSPSETKLFFKKLHKEANGKYVHSSFAAAGVEALVAKYANGNQ